MFQGNSVSSADLCDKSFLVHHAFSAGIYTLGKHFFTHLFVRNNALLGCVCDKNITLGFGILLDKGGPKNLFSVLQCRDIDMNHLEGILVDHASIVDPYILNREADMICWLMELTEIL